MDVKIILQVRVTKPIPSDQKIKLLSKEQQKSYQIQNTVISVKKTLEMNMCKIKNIVKLEIIVTIQGNIKVLHRA